MNRFNFHERNLPANTIAYFKPTIITLLFTLLAPQITLAQEITIASWGGAYEYAQRKAIFDPFEQLTGIKINTQLQKGGLGMLSGKSIPDLVDMEGEDAQSACQQSLLLELDFKELVAPANHSMEQPTPAANDFLNQSFSPCGIAHLTFSTLIAFKPSAFPGKKPQIIDDFFDLASFPGKRGLRKSPGTILEWALMAQGVPMSQVYDLLSTKRGLKLAFRRLETIREHIVWWEKPEQAGKLLADNAVVMTSGYNGRFFDAQSPTNPLIMLWDGQLIDRGFWVIPASHKVLRPEIEQFIRFATRPEQMAKLAEYIPYGPTRRSALEHIGNHFEKGTPMRGHLPTASHHLDRALIRDTSWYAHTEKLRKEAFERWLAE